MTDQPCTTSDGPVPEAEPASWRGDLFTVVIAGPGTLRWGIVVRAADADSARASTEARGHRVMSVRASDHAGVAATRSVLGKCINCQYSLANLPAGEAGEIMCPECGIINVPTSPLDAQRDKMKRRHRFFSSRVYLWLAISAAVVMILALARLL